MTNEVNSRYSGGELNGSAAASAAAIRGGRGRWCGKLPLSLPHLDVFSGVFMARDNRRPAARLEEATLTGKCRFVYW